MKQVLERLWGKEETQEKFQFISSIVLILLFLAFWGASFYVLVSSFA